MTTVDEALAEAHELTYEAIDRLLAISSFDASAAGMRCREVAALLEDCGASPFARGDRPDLAAVDARALLTQAVRILDEIPVAEQPLLLGSARAELTGALLDLSADD